MMECMQSVNGSKKGNQETVGPHLVRIRVLTIACMNVHSVKLQAIHRFTSTATAVEDMTAIGEGKVSKSLKKFLTEEVTGNKKFKNEKLAVSEPKLGMSSSFATSNQVSRC